MLTRWPGPASSRRGSVGTGLTTLGERPRKGLWKGEHKARDRNELGRGITKWLMWQKPRTERAEGGTAREGSPEHRARLPWRPQNSSTAIRVRGGDAELPAVRAQATRSCV